MNEFAAFMTQIHSQRVALDDRWEAALDKAEATESLPGAKAEAYSALKNAILDLMDVERETNALGTTLLKRLLTEMEQRDAEIARLKRSKRSRRLLGRFQ